MIRPSALAMAAAMTAVAVGTYYGLAFVPPGIVPGIGTASTHESPAASTETAAAPAPATAPDAAPAPAPTTEAEPAAEAEVEAVAETPASTEEPAAAAAKPSGGAADYASSEDIERALANEPPPEEDVVAKPKPKPKATPAPEPAPAAAAPAPKEEPKVAAAPEPPPAAAPAPKPEPKAAPAPKPQPKPAPPAAEPETQTSSAAPAEPPPKPSAAPAAADAIKQWWPDASKLPANQLKLLYAGPVQGQLAIAVLFSDALDLESLKQNSQVKNPDGSTATGEWQAGKNPKMAMYSVAGAGRYTVVLSPTVAGTGGFMLGTTLQGPIYVKAP